MAKTQSVRGTRDFYPDDMAFRQWLVDRWREASRRAGLAEVDGPELEPLELYTEKSGPEIAEQLYWLQDKSGRKLALRPEFTPTLARMIAARQASLPEPIRWFNISRCFRYERAQKGRLREFFQWNVDLVGVEGEIADAECISVAVDGLRSMGLGPQDVQVRINDRRLLGALVRHLGIAGERVPQVFGILDKRDKVPPETLAAIMAEAGLDAAQRGGLERILAWQNLGDIDARELATPEVHAAAEALQRLFGLLAAYGIADWCRFDIGIVRGLAYYTGPVWEVHDLKGEFRAIFGGGRYDRLLEELGAKAMPACGFGCGDVVLGLLLEERGLRPQAERPAEYFVASADGENWAGVLRVVRLLRERNLSTQFDLKGGNLKRQMKKAADAGARYVLIVGKDLAQAGRLTVRNMESGEQREASLEDLADLGNK
ncbi:MAG: histidine--tRNA ligase [Planctomycetes bacterium]|nr:histidine--tRNA ligase [Planctomycetota bacterium]